MSARVLVVEDDEDMQASVVDILESAGYDVEAASSSQEAIDMSQTRPFDLVVTDVRMAGLDGLQALERIQAVQPRIRSIVITGYASDDAPATAIRLEASDYIYKPFTRKDLLTSVERVLKAGAESQQYQSLLGSVLTHFRQFFVNLSASRANADLEEIEDLRRRAFLGFYVGIRSRSLHDSAALLLWDKLEDLDALRERLQGSGDVMRAENRKPLREGYEYVIKTNTGLVLHEGREVEFATRYASSSDRGPGRIAREQFAALLDRIRDNTVSLEMLKIAPSLRTVAVSDLTRSTELQSFYRQIWAPPDTVPI